MEKNLSVIIQPLIIISVVALILFKGISQKTETVMGVDTKNFAELFTVYVEEGDVFYKDIRSSDFVKIETEQINLPNKTLVKTDNGLAHVILPDSSVISLDKFTTIEIDVDAESTTIEQLYGNTWHRIKELSKIGEYKVETDNTIAAVRGTEFGVNFNENYETDVFVVESRVDISKYEDKDNYKEILNTKQLSANQWVKVTKDKNQDVVVQPIPEEMKKTVWYSKNTTVSSSLEEAKDLSKTNIITNIKKTKDTLGIEDQAEPTLLEQIQQSLPIPPIINKIIKLEKKLISEKEEKKSNVDKDEQIAYVPTTQTQDDSNQNESTQSTPGETPQDNPDDDNDPDHPDETPTLCTTGSIFQIGDVEAANKNNPMDEFNFRKVGLYPRYAYPTFIATGPNKNLDRDFPYGANAAHRKNERKDSYRRGYGANFNVNFDIPEGHNNSIAKLTFSWTPGKRNGEHYKVVKLDRETLFTTPVRKAKKVQGWWGDSERFIEGEEFEFEISEGNHNFTFQHFQSDHHFISAFALWDWVKLEIVDANCQQPIPPIQTGQVFLLGDKEAQTQNNPADEFNWRSPDFPLLGIHQPPYVGKSSSEPFIVGEHPNNLWPWNQNAGLPYAKEMHLKFDIEGEGTGLAKLEYQWSPGVSGSETKLVYLDGNLIKTTTHPGTNNPNYYRGYFMYKDEVVFNITQGEHILKFLHTTGDGTVWDWIELNVVEVIE